MKQPLMISAFGELAISRVPLAKKESLGAFDQADLLALDYLQKQALLGAASRVLIVNDTFGAMTCAVTQVLVAAQAPMPVMWSDSHIAHLGLEHNAQANDLPMASFVQAQNTPQGPFDLVLLRLPKSHALLRDQLIRMLPQLAPETLIVMPMMVKHIDNALYQLVESLLGPLTTSLAHKKARLIFAVNHEKVFEQQSKPQEASWGVPAFGISLQNFSGVFGRTKLDPGAQVLLEQFPEGPYESVIDLGCGNGVQAIAAAKKWPNCKVVGIDESYMSVASSTINAENNGVADRCDFKANDCLSNVEAQTADLILCNPPFHQERVIGDQIAMRMFAQAAKVLTKEGELWVVGNRHLGYHAKLKRWFSRVEQVGAHPKFVVLKAQV